MKIKHKAGAFEVEITGSLLVVRRVYDNLFTCRLNPLPWFVLHSDGLYAQNSHDALTPLYRGNDANELLGCISTALSLVEEKCWFWRKFGVLFLCFCLVVPAAALQIYKLAAEPVLPHVSVSTSTAKSLSSDTSAVTLMPAYQGAQQEMKSPEIKNSSTPPAPADNWPLPESKRGLLASNLKRAASRELFTIPLSSGHPRTLYVFADPECPNCQRMERLFEGASHLVNIVIFPVTIAGGADSLKTLAPIMALPEAERAEAWKRVFSSDAGIEVPGSHQGESEKVTDEATLEAARASIGVNEVAFRAYQVPGTPWTISDDGRYVPQAKLDSPAALQAFLNEGKANE